MKTCLMISYRNKCIPRIREKEIKISNSNSTDLKKNPGWKKNRSALFRSRTQGSRGASAASIIISACKLSLIRGGSCKMERNRG